MDLLGTRLDLQGHPYLVAARVLRSLPGGDTILLHDSDTAAAPESWRSTLGTVPSAAVAVMGLPQAQGARGQLGGPSTPPCGR